MARDLDDGPDGPSSVAQVLPEEFVERLSELDESELRTVISYTRSLLPEPPTVQDLLEEQPGERILDVEDRDWDTKVVKMQPCAQGCDECPHGPYLYNVRVEKHPDGGEQPSLHWEFMGRLHRS